MHKQFMAIIHKEDVAVQLDIDTFEKIENVLENYALHKLMQDDESEVLNFEDTKQYYSTLDKN